MKRSIVNGAAALSVVVAALAVTTATTAGASAPRDRLAPLSGVSAGSTIPGSYIVVLKAGAATRAAADRARAAGATVTHEYRSLRGYAAELSAAELRTVRQDPAVSFVEPDQVVSASTTQTNPPWGLDRIDQRALPLNAQYTYTPTGLGVDAYIIDTGLRSTHSQFTGRTAAGFSVFSDRDGVSTNDCNGHGTHVAGTVGGTTYGVAKQVTLVPVRVLDCSGNGTDSGVIAGMDWVVAHASGPSVANMSLGGGPSAALDAAVTRMTNAGITLVVAAGNDNANACGYSPSRAPSAITIGSTTSSDARSSFSNFGSCVDLFAPGSSILSAWWTSNTATTTISGTSMASPHVAGIAALYLQGNPTASPSAVTSAITSAATAGKVTSPGTGSPNLLAYSLLDGSPPPTSPPNVTLDPASQTVAAGSNATFTSAATGTPTPTVQWQVDTGAGFTNLAGATSTTLTLNAVTAGMNGYDYRAVFTNSAGSDTSASANLTVTTSPPPPPPSDCDETVTGTITSRAPRVVATSFTTASAGTLTGCLTGPAGTDFELYLERFSGARWQLVAAAEGPTSTENVTYSATAGTYRWVVFAASGVGAYTLKFGRP